MRILLQRVKEAKVTIATATAGRIKAGLLIFLGIEAADTDEDIDWLVKKVSQLRIFNDKNSIMNLSVMDVQGEILVVSQFTLHAKTKKGNRPSYIHAASPEIAIPLYEKFIYKLTEITGSQIQTGEFGAMMDVELINDGPVTIWMDSKNKDY